MTYLFSIPILPAGSRQEEVWSSNIECLKMFSILLYNKTHYHKSVSEYSTSLWKHLAHWFWCFLKQFWPFSFMNVFSWAVLAASASWLSSVLSLSCAFWCRPRKARSYVVPNEDTSAWFCLTETAIHILNEFKGSRQLRQCKQRQSQKPEEQLQIVARIKGWMWSKQGDHFDGNQYQCDFYCNMFLAYVPLQQAL